MAANAIKEVHGILNGTCNYILTEMRETGREFGDVLAEAQKLGYAESDPSFDIDGVDAAHKLAILTSVAFGCPVDFGAVYIEGIRASRPGHQEANDLGYRIKLLGIARLPNGVVEERVHPAGSLNRSLAPAGEGVFNAVFVEGDFAERATSCRAGAGAAPPPRRSPPTSWMWRAGAVRPVFRHRREPCTHSAVAPLQEP